MSDPGTNGAPGDDEDWPEPMHTPEEFDRATKAYEATFSQRRRVLRYAYVALGVLVILAIVVALIH
jgi:hypothetical protein